MSGRSRAPTPGAVLFDLDGTLTDSKPGIVNSTLYALRRFNIETGSKVATPDPQSLNFMLGPPLRESFARLVGQADAERLVALYRERFEPVGMFENSVYPGVPAALESLAGAGYRLFVATSKPEIYARRILDHFRLSRFFDAVHGAGTDGTGASKFEIVADILKRRDIEPRLAAMIGDRREDMIGAKAAKVSAIGALWGYGSRHELSEAGADPLLESPGQIAQAIEERFQRRARNLAQ